MLGLAMITTTCREAGSSHQKCGERRQDIEASTPNMFDFITRKIQMRNNEQR